MYRSSPTRLLTRFLRTPTRYPTPTLPDFLYPTHFCTSTTTTTTAHSPNPNPNRNPFQLNSSDTSQTTSSTTTDEETSRSAGRRRTPVTEFKEEQSRVLKAALHHVNSLGWSEEAVMAGAREVGVSPCIVGSFSRKEAALVEYFMDECLERLVDIIETDVELKNLTHSERISKLVKIRLDMQAPYISKWAQALSIQALPTNVPTSFKQRATLVDEIWHSAGDQTTDLDWYVKRTILGGIYSTTEVYMLTDKSSDFRDTWAFLDGRMKDAFDLKKTLQEAQNLAESVSTGLGSSVQGLVKEVFKP